MKKIILTLILLFFSFTNIYAFSEKEEKVINIFIKKIEEISEKKGNFFRIAINNKLKNILKKGNFGKDKTKVLEKIIFILDENISKNKIEKISGKLENYNVDFEKIKNYWLDLTNEARKSNNLKNYKYNERLEETAFKWSKYQKNLGTWTHKRNPGDSYYDYGKIRDWFVKNGVKCKNINRVTFTENVGNRSFSCKNNSDCTENFKQAIKRTFDFYMSEKGKTSSPHYNSIVNKYFQNIGIGIAIKENGKNNFKYFLTVHYCTELE